MRTVLASVMVLSSFGCSSGTKGGGDAKTPCLPCPTCPKCPSTRTIQKGCYGTSPNRMKAASRPPSTISARNPNSALMLGGDLEQVLYFEYLSSDTSHTLPTAAGDQKDIVAVLPHDRVLVTVKVPTDRTTDFCVAGCGASTPAASGVTVYSVTVADTTGPWSSGRNLCLNQQLATQTRTQACDASGNCPHNLACATGTAGTSVCQACDEVYDSGTTTTQRSHLVAKAIAVPGYWDGTGSYFASGPSGQDVVTLSCITGAVAKCVHFGYQPGQPTTAPPCNTAVSSLTPYHQACVRAARADYAGIETSYSCRDTFFDIVDGIGIQARDTSGMSFEAAWKEDGAVPLSGTTGYVRPRYNQCVTSLNGNSAFTDRGLTAHAYDASEAGGPDLSTFWSGTSVRLLTYSDCNTPDPGYSTSCVGDLHEACPTPASEFGSCP